MTDEVVTLQRAVELSSFSGPEVKRFFFDGLDVPDQTVKSPFVTLISAETVVCMLLM